MPILWFIFLSVMFSEAAGLGGERDRRQRS
jgi:hypothetical protein